MKDDLRHMYGARQTAGLQMVCDGDVSAPDIKLPLSQSQNSTQNTSRVNS